MSLVSVSLHNSAIDSFGSGVLEGRPLLAGSRHVPSVPAPARRKLAASAFSQAQAYLQLMTTRYSKAHRTKEEGQLSIARVYADVNTSRPQEYWDYEALTIQWGRQDDYSVVRKVRLSRFAAVYVRCPAPWVRFQTSLATVL